ncbi:pollen receptor-like kinase 3 [Apium graveolens]|uniref:pollen receptor-like kinase 3 n=1 Tax=Apium graveolens TaxID=4045 RepID=UPI003D79589B
MHGSTLMANVKVLRIPLLFYSFFFFNFPLISSQSSNPDSSALLQLKKSFKNNGFLSSWQSGTEPCAKGKQWLGLVCENGMVTGVHLGTLGLSGKIDIDALKKIPNLRSMSISGNSFEGPIPEINKLSSLKAVYLANNQFSGKIPSDYFKGMGSLKKLWLSNNNFTGEIPSSLTRISSLISIHLNDNQFSGNIPEFKQQSLVSFNVSNNNLKGEIPSALSKFNETSFAGNEGLCGKQLGKECEEAAVEAAGPSSSPTAAPNNKSNKRIAFWLMLLCVLILGIMVFVIVVMKRRQENEDTFQKDNIEVSMESAAWEGDSKDIEQSLVSNQSREPSHKGTMAQKARPENKSAKRRLGDLVVVNDKNGVFGLEDLMRANAEVLGNGTMGSSSYKAEMPNGFKLVVKRIKDMNKVEKDKFDAEIRQMSAIKHPNILAPLAYHYRNEEKLLVSEFVPKGSLLYILHGDRGPTHAELNWPARLKIIKGIARGLDYLHTQYASSELPHGNLKSSNVLVASDYEPLLVDFGMNSLTSNNQATQLFSYKSPEISQGHKVSPKCDVYCLGIIILEIITGKFPTQYLNHGSGGIDVVEGVKRGVLEGREAELLDPEIVGDNSAVGQMQRLLQIGVACSERNPDQRLDIRNATRQIEEI